MIKNFGDCGKGRSDCALLAMIVSATLLGGRKVSGGACAQAALPRVYMTLYDTNMVGNANAPPRGDSSGSRAAVARPAPNLASAGARTDPAQGRDVRWSNCLKLLGHSTPLNTSRNHWISTPSEELTDNSIPGPSFFWDGCNRRTHALTDKTVPHQPPWWASFQRNPLTREKS